MQSKIKHRGNIFINISLTSVWLNKETTLTIKHLYSPLVITITQRWLNIYIHLSWSPLHNAAALMANGRQTGFKLFFITSVLWTTVNLGQKIKEFCFSVTIYETVGNICHVIWQCWYNYINKVPLSSRYKPQAIFRITKKNIMFQAPIIAKLGSNFQPMKHFLVRRCSNATIVK